MQTTKSSIFSSFASNQLLVFAILNVVRFHFASSFGRLSSSHQVGCCWRTHVGLRFGAQPRHTPSLFFLRNKRSHLGIMSAFQADEDDDMFGDDSMFENFDLEAAMQIGQQQNKENLQNTHPAALTPTVPVSKRAKTSPYSSNTRPPSSVGQTHQFHTGKNNAQELEATLQKHFGFSKFRNGQKQVLESVLHGRDAAVFWATGSGKSICYQIPPLHTGQVGIVISPLVSLMQDQVNKINGLSNEKLATFLGSSQMDPTEESKALNGDYSLVYITPEKIMSGDLIARLANLHTTKRKICLIAIDESHCVSEWGHDFRPEYRSFGAALRTQETLRHIPLLAVTATAVPRVQQDILRSLQLHDPYISRQTFDRTNLYINVRRKKQGGGYRAALQSFLSDMKLPHTNSGSQSTIIYVPSRDAVDEITAYLTSQLPNTRIEGYHAGLSTLSRSQAHTNFLVGKTTIIVATIAFGMGIDKPDTRRIIHYGPPKTVEEYYQQIGRAGRDGLKAECTMYVNENDFDKYKSEFYLKNLSGDAKQAIMGSMDALRKYSFDTETCRRKALLNFFHEQPSFGDRCGTCDNCVDHKLYGDENERDFGPLGARVLLKAASVLNGQAKGMVEKVVAGNTVEDYRYQRGTNATMVAEEIKAMKQAVTGKRKTKEYYRELFEPLVQKGYLSQTTKQKKMDTGFSMTWGVYEITPKGLQALNDCTTPILLPVPPSLREVERIEEEKRQAVLAQLKEAGVKLEELPKDEVDNGEGEVIQSYRKWHSKLESMRRTNEERATQLEDLYTRIQTWRADTAEKLQMAPSTVLAEHIIASIAYMVATLPTGVAAIERESLVAVGVRTKAVDSLVATLSRWVEEVQPKGEAAGKASANGAGATQKMILPDGLFTPSGPWEFAVYKPNKKTGKAVWESSHERFMNGEHPQAIAMKPESGRIIQVNTVIGHCLDGLIQGRPLPLKKLAAVLPPPNKMQWERLQQAERETNIDVTGDPNTSNNGDKFTMTAFLAPIMGDEFITKPYDQRTPEEGKAFAEWCEALKWYMALRKVGLEPKFTS